MFALTLLVTLAAVMCAGAAVSAPLPGKALVWSNARAPSQPHPRYVTRSLGAEELSQWIAGESGDAELVVLFSQAQTSVPCTRSALVQQVLANTGSGAAEPTSFQYVYAAADQPIAQTLLSAAPKDALLVAEPAQLNEEALSALLQNGKTDFVHVPLSSAQASTSSAAAQTLRALLANQQGKKVVFVAVDESAVARPAALGEFVRVLEESAADPIYVFGDPLYKPEGAEYSIYYAGQYLYITPDIFTGLLTSLFISFTLLVGLSCLGSIQGMSSFYDKLPVVGKEA